MKMNYKNWFYEQYKYLQGNRDGVNTYNDTKWVDINTRYKNLIDMNSELLSKQSFGIIGNNKGFDKLIDLMSRSNYTFDDVNTSLIDTFNRSLKNSMGRMLVNTHSSIFHCKSSDNRYVSIDKISQYYIIDIPFNQLHFGDRDEFIRQRFEKMFLSSKQNYVSLNDFVNTDITSILGFSIMCTVNGFITNDFMIAIDDKGFRIKVGWLYSSDADFVVYMLDNMIAYKCNIKSSYITEQNKIPSECLSELLSTHDVHGMNCIVDIYDNNYVKTVSAVPNFGTFDDKGNLKIKHIQPYTIEMLNKNKTQTASVIIYAFKFMHELPNVYPAVNYYDIMNARHVYANDNAVVDINGKEVFSSDNKSNELEICTPPIALDRPINMSFNTILSCLSINKNLMKFNKTFTDVGRALQTSLTDGAFEIYVKMQLNEIYDDMYKLYITYIKGSILTSLVPYTCVERFKNLLINIDRMRNTTLQNSQLYTIDEYFEENYKYFVNTISAPFENNILSNFNNMDEISYNYFTSDNYTRFNRPVTDQSFIAMKYNRDLKCWLFDYPDIKAFKGIGNTFYVNTKLKGDEVFKFFVLYSDTEAPAKPDQNIEPFNFDDIFDFDKFYEEADKHVGFMRYWYNENKLLKISKLMYNEYSPETTVQVLSKILKRKIDCDSIIDEYPSDIEYEPSAVTSFGEANENEDISPFALNYLFYTVLMLNDHEDELQSYFYNKLVNDKFENGYVDIDVSDLILSSNQTLNVNYSQITVAPNNIDVLNSVLPSNTNVMTFLGLPLIVQNQLPTLSNLYRYTFNTYDGDTKYFLTGNNDNIDTNHYVSYLNPEGFGHTLKHYSNDARICRLVMIYMNYVNDYISKITTNYGKSYNQTSVIDEAMNVISKCIRDICEFATNKEFEYPETQTIINLIISDDNIVMSTLSLLRDTSDTLMTCLFNSHYVQTSELINTGVLSTLQYINRSFGFDDSAKARIRAFYIHLKKFNTLMNPYQYKHWLLDIDLTIIRNMDDILAENENYDMSPTTFSSLWSYLLMFIARSSSAIGELISYIKDFDDEVKTTHIDLITQYCDNFITSKIFDMYIIDHIEFISSDRYIDRPYAVYTQVSVDSHFKIPNTSATGTIGLVFHPSINKDGSLYIIESVDKVCEYAVFDGSDLWCILDIIGEDGRILESIDGTIKFKKIGTSSDMTNEVSTIQSFGQTIIEMENNHDSYTVNAQNEIINNEMSNMNYDLLSDGAYNPLHHETEMILNPSTYMPGSIDRIIIPNNTINKIACDKYSKHISNQVWFKPSRILHINTSTVKSIYGKYFVGQTIFLETDDHLCIFRAKVTAIDHSQSHGFVEAEIDNNQYSWFTSKDPTTIHKYLTTDVVCHTLPDNISNFMDEYSNSELTNFTNVFADTRLDHHDDTIVNGYSLPGDPIYVTNNTNYVYSRLSWMFSDLVSNRFIDDDHKCYSFTYLGHSFINDISTDNIKIKLVNHNFCQLTNPELYPVLRDEPNDHDVWDQEVATFTDKINISKIKSNEYLSTVDTIMKELETVVTEARRYELVSMLDETQINLEYELEYQKRLNSYIQEPETATTWHSVYSYDDTLSYIDNGRAKNNNIPTFIPNIRDIPYTDDLDVFIYDWEHKMWLSPSIYTITPNIIDNIKLGEYDDYRTSNVMYSITITPTSSFIPSKKLLVYIAYRKSDVFNDVVLNNNTCNVRFKSIISMDKAFPDVSFYKDILVRKHLNGYEEYQFDEYNCPSDFNIAESYMITRVERNGKYNSPPLRLHHLTAKNGSTTIDYTNFDLFVRMPFKDVEVNTKFKEHEFFANVNKPIYNLSDNESFDNVKFICVQADHFNGNISDIMFTGSVASTYGRQVALIHSSTLPTHASGSFICTVFQDNSYKPFGGLITITVTINETELNTDNLGKWILVPPDLNTYRLLPDEFILVPRLTIDTTKPIIFTFQNHYDKNSNDEIDLENDNIDNPYEFYYNNKLNIRYPISDTRSHPNDRLVINQTINTDVNVIKTTHICVCRYSLQRIPKDGIIDVTGYIPTPLSRNRYQFWINGKEVTKTEDLIILSPTSFQLCNMTSLRNFELLEMVDDMYESDIMDRSNVYITLSGKTFSSYKNALLSNQNIINQSIQFMFNTNQHELLQDYTRPIIKNPNNNDIETDIISTITFEEPAQLDYSLLYNKPTICNIPLQHLNSKSLPFESMSNLNISDIMDRVWKKEITTNPLFLTTHKDGLDIRNDKILRLHVKPYEDKYVGYVTGVDSSYFSMYISNNADDVISDISNTLQIIPFVKCGIYIVIDKSFRGKWLHTTNNTTPVKI